MRASRLSVVVVAALLTLAACGEEAAEVGSGTDATPAAPATSTTSAPGDAAASTAGEASSTVPGASPSATAPAPGNAPVSVPEALDVAANTVSDGPLSLASYAGTPVALWFWAPG